VQWRSPAACPAPRDLLARIARSSGASFADLAGKLVRLVVEVTRRPDGRWSTRIVVITAAGTGERRFEADSCQELVNGTVLVVGLSLDPRVTRRPPVKRQRPEARTVASNRPKVRIPLRLLFNTSFGVLHQPSFGLGLTAALAFPSFKVELDLGHELPRRVEVDPVTGAGADLRLVLRAGLRACYIPWRRRVELGACVGSEAGWLHARGVNIREARSEDALWLGLLGGVTAGVRLVGRFWLRVEGHIGASPTRPSFEIEGIGLVHRPSVLVGRVGIGVEAWLF
jgi:hypothetical protein